MPDFDEAQLYQQIHRENTARFQVTPAWQFIRRHRLFQACRKSAVALHTHQGGDIRLPETLAGSWKTGCKSAWAGGGAIAATILGSIILFLGIIVGGVALATATGGPAGQEDPPGIIQDGYSYILPAGWETTVEPSFVPERLCLRLPGRPDMERIVEGSGGELRIECKTE